MRLCERPPELAFDVLDSWRIWRREERTQVARDTLLAARKLSITYCGKFAIGVEDEELIQRKVELLHFRGLGEMTKHTGIASLQYFTSKTALTSRTRV